MTFRLMRPRPPCGGETERGVATGDMLTVAPAVHMRNRFAGTLETLVLVVTLFFTLATTALATTIEVTSPKGLKVWLVEDHTSPLLTLGFRFAGGSAQDPPGKEGLAHLAAEMFFQGAGNQQADDYLQSWNELGAEVTVDARVESLRGTLKVLTRDRDKAVRLLAMAVQTPRADTDALEQVRDQVLAEIDRDATDPETIAFGTYSQMTYGVHPLARPINGTRASIATIDAADILMYRSQMQTRGGLALSAVGDITPMDLGLIVDKVFAALPVQNHVRPVPAPQPAAASRSDLPMQAAQAQVVFGVSLPHLSAREQLAAELLNYTLGGSPFTSRLYRQVREQRGLAYAIGTTFDTYSFGNELTGSFGSQPDTVEEAIGLVREEFARLASQGPADAEVEEAKAALAGQYLRGLIKQIELANELTLRMGQGQTADFIDSYAKRRAAITPDEVRAFARSLPWLERLTVVTVGARGAPGSVAAERSRLHAPPAQEP